jgi:hypothetical protein
MIGWSKSDTGLEGALARTFANEHTELLWLAFLLTGDREMSVDAVAGATDMNDAGNPFFRNWMISWSRKLVIAKALSVVEFDMAESVRRTRERRYDRPAPAATENWSLDAAAGKEQLEHALLAIDLFPRCALLLTVFEKVSIQDTASLLNADREAVRSAKAIGLAELTCNLADPDWHEAAARNAGQSCLSM